MTYVQSRPARIGKHIEHVEFPLGRIQLQLSGIRRVKQLPLLPNLLPFWLDPIEWVRFTAFAHGVMKKFSESADQKSGNLRKVNQDELMPRNTRNDAKWAVPEDVCDGH